MSSSDIKHDVLAAIGNTPLIRLKGPSERTGCEILGKAEFMNPGQSVKDRAALAIVNREPTSMDGRADVVIHAEIGAVLREIVP